MKSFLFGLGMAAIGALPIVMIAQCSARRFAEMEGDCAKKGAVLNASGNGWNCIDRKCIK